MNSGCGKTLAQVAQRGGGCASLEKEQVGLVVGDCVSGTATVLEVPSLCTTVCAALFSQYTPAWAESKLCAEKGEVVTSETDAHISSHCIK